MEKMKGRRSIIKKRYQKASQRQHQKGLTLVEAVVAIALVSIVSVGVTSLFFSLSKISKISNAQLEVNGLIRIVKENVTQSVRTGHDILGNAGKNAGTDQTDLSIEDLAGQDYPEYCFDVSHVGSFHYGEPSKMIQKYEIKIQRRTGEVLSSFFIEVYP